MTEYIAVKIRLSPGQRSKIRRGVMNEVETTLQIKHEDIDNDPGMMLNFTQRQVDKLKDIAVGRSGRFTFSKTQLKTMKSVVEAPLSVKRKTAHKAAKSVDDDIADIADKMVELSLTPSDVEKIKRVRFNDIPEVHEFEGEGLGSLIKLAVPFIKKFATSVLPTLGLAAASGAISGATHKATKGKGLKRAGSSIKLSKKDVCDCMKIGNVLQEHEMVPKNFVTKMNAELKKQSGGFIGTLLAGLAGSLLPSLLGGKGLKRAGKGLGRAGQNLKKN